MASVDDIDELIATRKLNGLNDNLYKNETMSEEAFNEIIDNFEVVTYLTEYGRRGIKENVKRLQKENEEKDKYIKHSEEITTEMNEDINKLLIEIKEKDKQIDLMADFIYKIWCDYPGSIFHKLKEAGFDESKCGFCEHSDRMCKDCLKQYFENKVKE